MVISSVTAILVLVLVMSVREVAFTHGLQRISNRKAV